MHIETGSGTYTLFNNGKIVTPFTIEGVIEAIKTSNFIKGLGPDCFDGNVLGSKTKLKSKVV
jgi:hypothetical protein